MKPVLIFISVLSICVTQAHHEHGKCGSQQGDVVKRQWTETFNVDIRLSQFGRALFTSFFQKCPEARELFDGNGDLQSLEFRNHAIRLIRRLEAEIQQLGDSSQHQHDHDALVSNTTPTINAAFKAIFTETLASFVGDEMDVAAWTECLEQIIQCIFQ